MRALLILACLALALTLGGCRSCGSLFSFDDQASSGSKFELLPWGTKPRCDD